MKKGDCVQCNGTGLVPRGAGDPLGHFGPGLCLKCNGTGGGNHKFVEEPKPVVAPKTWPIYYSIWHV